MPEYIITDEDAYKLHIDGIAFAYSDDCHITDIEDYGFAELVRCKDCKHYEFRCGSGMCMMGVFDGDYELTMDFFCAWGERRSE